MTSKSTDMRSGLRDELNIIFPTVICRQGEHGCPTDIVDFSRPYIDGGALVSGWSYGLTSCKTLGEAVCDILREQGHSLCSCVSGS